MPDPETIEVLSERLNVLDSRLSALHSSAMMEARQGLTNCALEVSRLERRLAGFAAQQSAMIRALKELLPDFDRKREEANKAGEKELRDIADQIAQSFVARYGKKPDQR
jgi:hypothetical protein